MQTIIKPFILVILFLAQNTLAVTSCFDRMQEQKAKFDHVLVYQNQVYKVDQVLEGTHGGKLVKLKRWHSSVDWKIPRTEDHGTAPPGNPLRIFKALPKSILDFFNFRMYDENDKRIYNFKNANPEYIVIPDVYEINGAIKELNISLVKNGYDGLPFQFYLDSGVVSDSSFLKNYFEHLAQPFSSNNEIAYHDLNYHLIPFLIFNGRMVELSKIHSEVFLKFSNWLKSSYPKASQNGLLKKVFAIRANHIDGTGNIHLMMAEPDFKPHHGPAIRAMKGFVGWGKSPFEYLSLTFEGAWKNSPDRTFKQVTAGMLAEFGKTLPPEFFVVDKESAKFYADIEAVKSTISARLNELRFAIMGMSKAELENERELR